MFKQKSVWAQLGMGSKGRDTLVLEDAQAKDGKNTALLRDFAPQGRNRDQLPQRPSTSAGPASSFSKRKNAEKRETKDDLHVAFNPLAAHGKETTFYNFPLPSALPTPATTPKSSPPSRFPTLVRPATPDSMEAVPVKMEPSPMEIGMALGSPAHPPASYQIDTSDLYTRNFSPAHTDLSSDGGGTYSPPMLRRKPSKWKTFGGLFGGKKHTQAFYQVQPEVPSLPSSEQYVHLDESLVTEKIPKAQNRERTMSERKNKKGKLEVKRSNTTPMNFTYPDSSGQYQTPDITLEGERLGEESLGGASAMNSNAKGLLNVDIPSVQMERYSIMFSGVLQKSGPQSSLLARRQATLDRLKTVNEAIASKEQELLARQQRPRRASSPQAKSPAFSLFPSTPSRTREGSPSPYRLNHQRSNTSPAMLSPSRPTFAPKGENEAHARILAAAAEAAAKEDDAKRALRAEVRIPNLRKKGPKPESEPEPDLEYASPMRPEVRIPSTRKKTPKPDGLGSDAIAVSPTPKWSTEGSHLTLDSSDIEDETEPYDPAPLPMKPKLTEPNWHMINPGKGHGANSSLGSATSRSNHSTSISASSMTTSLNDVSPSLALMQLSPEPLRPSPTGRSRSATTTAPSPKTSRVRSATISGPSKLPRRSPNSQSAFADEDEELRLKTAADVSIARQISVSRQQRQLLVPIKSPLKKPNSLNLSTERNGKQNQDLSSPSITLGMAIGGPSSGGLSVNRVASPLVAVAMAMQEECQRVGSPLAASRLPLPQEERLVEGVKPVMTPTLVVVGGSRDEKERLWQGATQKQHETAKNSHVGLAERRRGNGNTAANLNLSGGSGEIRVGLAIGAVHVKDVQNRRSERVVVERISASSN